MSKPKSVVLVFPCLDHRCRYEIKLTDDVELIVNCADGFELCAGRARSGAYRLWARKEAVRK
jgi:hypothetical protein